MNIKLVIVWITRRCGVGATAFFVLSIISTWIILFKKKDAVKGIFSIENLCKTSGPSALAQSSLSKWPYSSVIFDGVACLCGFSVWRYLLVNSGHYTFAPLSDNVLKILHCLFQHKPCDLYKQFRHTQLIWSIKEWLEPSQNPNSQMPAKDQLCKQRPVSLTLFCIPFYVISFFFLRDFF